MSGIFGLFLKNGEPSERSMLETMGNAMTKWGSDGSHFVLEGSVGMGQMRLISTSEARFEKLPLKTEDKNGPLLFTAAGRVDNREDLIMELGLSGKEKNMPDSDLLLHAYLKWGKDGPERIYGDWAFAVYHRNENRMFLARDHQGNTSLFYYSDKKIFAFASSRKALLALGLEPLEMDELYLAQVLVAWLNYHGERTIHKPIKRLPPSHWMDVFPDRTVLNRYFRLEDTQYLHLPRKEDYYEIFRNLFDEAVRCRVRSSGNIGLTLSGGLDSGSVAVTAAEILKPDNRRLFAFTSVPQWDTFTHEGNNFGDETPFAQATADSAENIDLFKIKADDYDPIYAIRTALDMVDEPMHGPSNFFWINHIMKVAKEKGCRVLLTGQKGNGGISWKGDIFSQPLAVQMKKFGWKQWPKEAVKRYAPARFLHAYRNMNGTAQRDWSGSAINPVFAERLNLRDRMREAQDYFYGNIKKNPRNLKMLLIRPGRCFGGARWAEFSASHGIESRDPTADTRLLSFMMSVPDHFFINPETGMERWFIREAMKNRLPDHVRLNKKKGKQSADIVHRLRTCAHEVDEALNELAEGPSSNYVNVPYMRDAWTMVQTHNTQEAYSKSVNILTRGIMAGLWVNGFYHAS